MPANQRRVEITEKDIPLYCPQTDLWSEHPLVYLPIEAPESKGHVFCPYCNTEYVLVDEIKNPH